MFIPLASRLRSKRDDFRLYRSVQIFLSDFASLTPIKKIPKKMKNLLDKWGKVCYNRIGALITNSKPAITRCDKKSIEHNTKKSTATLLTFAFGYGIISM